MLLKSIGPGGTPGPENEVNTMNCKLCDRLIISQTVTFSGGTLTVNLPAGAYSNGGRYCIVIAQTIPATATITAPVVVTIGDGTDTYPLTGRDCTQVQACSLRTRHRYAVQIATSATGGTFRVLGQLCPSPENRLAAIDGGAAASTEGGAAG